MTILGSVLAFTAGIAARPRMPLINTYPAKNVPVVDPKAQRIAELENTVARLSEENLHLQDAANGFAKGQAKEKARADNLAAQLAEQAITLRAAEEAIRHLSTVRDRALDRLTMYEGRIANFTRRGEVREYPAPVAREHLCCIPARHDFLTRGARSLAEMVERSFAESFPRTARYAELDATVIGMDGRVRHTPVLNEDEQREMVRGWNEAWPSGPRSEPPDAA